MLTIRPAKDKDANAIVSIIKRAFDDDAQLTTVERLIHTLTVATNADDEAVGFVSSFSTHLDNTHRREIDLLAVLPEYRGQGAATRLISASLESAPPHDMARGLVRVGNTGAKRAFGNNGFATDGVKRPLRVWSPQASSQPFTANDADHLIYVDTLLYSGIWIEQWNTSQTLANARQIAATKGFEFVSSATALDDDYANHEIIGEYQWWIRNLSR